MYNFRIFCNSTSSLMESSDGTHPRIDSKVKFKCQWVTLMISSCCNIKNYEKGEWVMSKLRKSATYLMSSPRRVA